MDQNLPNIDTDKAYILGLVIGGGEIIGNRLLITLPYRNWGSLRINPERAGDISGYILNTLRPIWKSTYNTELSYTVENNSWKIYCQLEYELEDDLISLSLPTSGKLKETVSISKLTQSLNNSEKIKRFIAGLTDTVGSLAKSHRHRVNSNQIISYEFSGKNFKLIADLAGLFYKIDCKPDQILWNHPNFHSGTNRYYSAWKKGFKLRIKLRDYMISGNFVSEAKKLSAEENMELQNQEFNSSEARLNINGRTTLHIAENSDWLPISVRGLHFIHYSHLLYCLGAPVDTEIYKFLQRKLDAPEKLISPFTIITKGTKSEIRDIIRNEQYLNKTAYIERPLNLPEIINAIDNNDVDCMYGINGNRGFPKSNILHAIVYVSLAQMGGSRLAGSRVLGSINEVFDDIKNIIPSMQIKIKHPNKGTCLIIEGGDFSALVGYVDNEFNKVVINVNKATLHLQLRNPSYEECFDI